MDPQTIQAPDTIDAPRVVLRSPRAEDGAQINRGVHESFKELHQWMEWARLPPTMEESEAYARTSQAKFLLRQQLDYRIFLKTDAAYAGNVSLFNINWAIPSGEIGYWLRSAWTGQGYMSEAVVGLSGMAMNVLKFNRVEIRCDVNNTRSRRVAERAGFNLEGILRAQSRGPDGALRDTCVFAMVSASR